MKRFGKTQFAKNLARAAFGLALVLLLWPATSSAAVGRCVEVSVSDMAEQGATSWIFADLAQSSLYSSSQLDANEFDTDKFDESQSSPDPQATELAEATESYEETPCGTDPDADPSSNFCFEDAEGQISTLPRLLAQWRGEKAANSVIDSMLAAMESAETEPSPELIAASIDVDLGASAPKEEDSCTSNPDECRSLPPLPPTLTVDVSAPAARQMLYLVDIPTRSSQDQTRAFAHLRVGPQSGHRDPPDKPPRT